MKYNELSYVGLSVLTSKGQPAAKEVQLPFAGMMGLGGIASKLSLPNLAMQHPVSMNTTASASTGDQGQFGFARFCSITSY